MSNPEHQNNPDSDFSANEITAEVDPLAIEADPKIVEEKDAAKKRFSALIDAVNEQYKSPDSTLANSPEQLKQFIEHNSEILDLCVERGMEKGLDDKELRMLEVSAILHDLAKADTPKSVVESEDLPEGSESISNLVLAMHHDLAAKKVEPLLEKNPDILKEILGDNYTEEEKQDVVSKIQKAIKSHMGPHPGFMDGILASVNKGLKEKGAQPIEHPYPEKGDKVAETLLAADMKSLAGRKGREKVMSIRKAVPFFVSQDLETVKKYKEAGVDLTQGEAALLSGFDSAEQARDMLPDQEDKDWLKQAIEESMLEPYDFGDEKVSYFEALRKRTLFEASKQEEK